MKLDSESDPIEVELEQELEPEELRDGPAHHPSAPPDELFDISTTVDPSYIISLIRRLLPATTNNLCNPPENVDCDVPKQESITHMDASDAYLSGDQVGSSAGTKHGGAEIRDSCEKYAAQKGEDQGACSRLEQHISLSEEKAWEEYGCVLWDLAASKSHAELMVHNLVLEVLSANLMISQSMRVMEICLGIMGNLACHEVPMEHIVAKDGLIETIVNQLFLDDAQCLCEVCRLLTTGLQSSKCITWAEALQSEHVLSRILWVSEYTLNPQLIEKSVGLLLALFESQQEVVHILLPCLMKLGLSSVLVNLFAFEMEKLTNERLPERYSILDVILRAIEALSAIEGHSQEICLNKELFQLVYDLVKLPDVIEVSSSCVSAVVLIANILSDAPNLAFEISQDLPFLQGLFDIFPFTADDSEARDAVWSIIARILALVQENVMSRPSLYEYVSILVSKTDLIEDDLLDQHLTDSSKEDDKLTTACLKSNARSQSLRRIISILNRWNALKDETGGIDERDEYHVEDVDVKKLLDHCSRHSGSGCWAASRQKSIRYLLELSSTTSTVIQWSVSK